MNTNIAAKASQLPDTITCLRIEFATPRVHIRVGGVRSTAVQR